MKFLMKKQSWGNFIKEKYEDNGFKYKLIKNGIIKYNIKSNKSIIEYINKFNNIYYLDELKYSSISELKKVKS
jgi:hypothetical protein